MQVIHVLYDKRNNALGIVEVGDKDLPEALRDAVKWRFEGRRYSPTGLILGPTEGKRTSI